MDPRRHRRLMFVDPPTQPDPTGPASSGGGPSGAPGGDTRTFTQADLDRIAAREKDQGKRAAMREFAEKHGFADVAAAEAFLENARKAETEKMSEADRKVAEATARETAALAKERAADERARVFARKEALLTLGAVGDNLEDALALLSRDLDDDATPEVVKEKADALKVRRPEFFTPADPNATPRTPAPTSRGTGTPPAHSSGGPAVAGARGKAEAERRFGTKATQSA